MKHWHSHDRCDRGLRLDLHTVDLGADVIDGWCRMAWTCRESNEAIHFCSKIDVIRGFAVGSLREELLCLWIEPRPHEEVECIVHVFFPKTKFGNGLRQVPMARSPAALAEKFLVIAAIAARIPQIVETTASMGRRGIRCVFNDREHGTHPRLNRP